MSTNLIIGVSLIGFGIFTLVARLMGLNVFSKRDAMKKAYGGNGGEAVHLIAYTALPIILGSLMAFNALNAQ